jgi:putative ABC transport system permease protein
MRWPHWLRRIWHTPLAEKQLDAELRFHLEQQVNANVANGMAPAEALRQANLEFGGLERFKEECRDARWKHHLDVLVRDFQFAFRGLRKDRRFAFVSIFALALGIGASTAIFSVVDNALLEPFPYKDQRNLVVMAVHNLDDPDNQERGGRNQYSYPEFQDYLHQNHVFDGFIGNAEDDVVYSYGDSNLRLGANYVTPGSFELLGVAPYLGRNLDPHDYEPGAPPVFVLRYSAWVAQFNADPSMIGKSFTLNGVPRTLVGITAPRFAWGGIDLWIPRDPVAPSTLPGRPFPAYWGAVGHLKPGVSPREAQADLNVIAKQLSSIYPKDYPKRFAIQVTRFPYAVVSPQFRNWLFIFCGAVGLLLLISCGNVANLVLARAITREKEFSLRTALGASRIRLLRQLLVESSLLAAGGALLGILLAWAGGRALSSIVPEFTFASETVIEMNRAVLLFAVIVSISTVFLFGLFPALQASRCNLADSMRDSGKGLVGSAGRTRVRNAVIVLEVALSFTLLFTAGLFVRSFMALRAVELGFQPDHILWARVPLPPTRYKTAAQLTSFFQPLLLRLKSLPGVAYAAESSTLPPFGGFRSSVQVLGKSHSDEWRSLVQLVSEDYFSVLRIQLLDGRFFTPAEISDGRKLAVINQSFQRRYFGAENPIGRRIFIDELEKVPEPVKDGWFEVIGVAPDVRNQGMQEPTDPEVWIPYSITGFGSRCILVRTAQDPIFMVKDVAREIRATDSTAAMAQPQTLAYYLDMFTFAQPRFALRLVTVFAVIGLLLVTVGVYGVIAYSTSRRTHEFGIRMALGARSIDVVKMVLRGGFRLLALGIIIGLAASFALSRIISSQLWGVSAHDPFVLSLAVTLLLVVGLVACWIPARRATRVNPSTSLRYE